MFELKDCISKMSCINNYDGKGRKIRRCIDISFN